jgi:hypothetical protein
MKTRLLFILATVLALASDGQVMPVGVKATQKGLTADSIFLVLQGKAVELSPFATGTKLVLAVSGIHGLSVRDNKAFPGCSMSVLDKNGKEVVAYNDLFRDTAEGVDRDDARYLEVFLPIGSPIVENANYRWKVRIWDKKTKAEMTIEIPISVVGVKDLLGIKKVTNGLTCQNAFIMSGVPLGANFVHDGDELDFVLTGVTGFTVQEGHIKLGAGMTVKDKTGDVILEYTDVFKDDDTNDPKEAETLHMTLNVDDPMTPGNTYLWTITVWDKLSQKRLETSVSLEVK